MRDPPNTATRRILASAISSLGPPFPDLCRRGRCRAFAPVVERTAAEGREARAEDHAGIDVIGARYHAVRKRALGLVEHRLNQLAAEALQLRPIVGDLLALRLALFPQIEPFAGLFPELALPDETSENVVALGRKVELLANMIGNVEPDHVHQLERPHRHAEFER